MDVDSSIAVDIGIDITKSEVTDTDIDIYELKSDTEELESATTESLAFSSERFSFNEEEGMAEEGGETVECINKLSALFTEFKRKKPPSLKEALESMGYGGENSEKLAEMFAEKGKGKLGELNVPGVTAEDAAVIFCYTYEWGTEKFGDSTGSPCRKLNNSLSVDRSAAAIRKTRAFLFLLLQALRKLPRYVPEDYVLYRWIRAPVKTEKGSAPPKHQQSYVAKCVKTWWPFTSTTEDPEVVKRLVGDGVGTLITLNGETWGYNISMFSDYPDEREVLLEPERQLRVSSVAREGDLTAVNARLLDAPLVLEDLIKVKAVKVREKRTKLNDVVENLRTECVTDTAIVLAWDPVVKADGVKVSYQVSTKASGESGGGESFTKTTETRYAEEGLERGEEYEFRVQCGYGGGWGKWSEEVKVVPFSWTRCPDNVSNYRKYSVYETNPRIASKKGDNDYCTVIGNSSFSHGKVASWGIKVLKSRGNNGNCIYIGVAPSSIDQNADDNYLKCGWYFSCYWSMLWSGPPHNYRGKRYGPRKVNGEYVHTGDKIGIVMDTTHGGLSFILNNVDLGVAFEGIPLDKPLAPCIILFHEGDSVELDLSEVKGTEADSSIPAPPNILAESGFTWDSITLAWDVVKRASFYQIEVDGGKCFDATTANTFTKRGLLPDTEHNFRVRTVMRNKVSEWSDVVKGRTEKGLFGSSGWKECPDDVNEKNKYSVDENNHRVATMVGNEWSSCTILGNTPVPPNAATSWSVKVLKSKKNNGRYVFVGIAPLDINQGCGYNYYKSGWYFDCFGSTLWSGPPHNHIGKEYGPRKPEGNYVRRGDRVGLMVDTVKGELSFVVNGVNYGVAYEGIPFAKPLVPCVILEHKEDSIEFII